ncbi:uncharacterized protein CC84DRAFT_483490 [Paraphaeosphaeria sporulosa]|uniref:Uncharacterized protein n=1 Tax=Paraphaeosphaeria sporulosa TaxID=1460663 RepID=A0A177CS94_9PLEO|nr:uncharacterized protein CC84DRAFT_483490 [Paraphaeosphaeria sporulosa]OAG10404.1 hypothetical protein CC84DRAFT_483490 [Paraphaeosphaeria sporulosa]
MAHGGPCRIHLVVAAGAEPGPPLTAPFGRNAGASSGPSARRGGEFHTERAHTPRVARQCQSARTKPWHRTPAGPAARRRSDCGQTTACAAESENIAAGRFQPLRREAVPLRRLRRCDGSREQPSTTPAASHSVGLAQGSLIKSPATLGH